MKERESQESDKSMGPIPRVPHKWGVPFLTYKHTDHGYHRYTLHPIGG